MWVMVLVRYEPAACKLIATLVLYDLMGHLWHLRGLARSNSSLYQGCSVDFIRAWTSTLAASDGLEEREIKEAGSTKYVGGRLGLGRW